MDDGRGWQMLSNVILDVTGLTRPQLREHFAEACEKEIGHPHVLFTPGTWALEAEYRDAIIPIVHRVYTTILAATNVSWKDDMDNWLYAALTELAPYRIRRWITLEKRALRKLQDSYQQSVSSSSGSIQPSIAPRVTDQIQPRSNRLESDASDTINRSGGIERMRQTIAFLLNAPENESSKKGKAPEVTTTFSISRRCSQGCQQYPGR